MSNVISSILASINSSSLWGTISNILPIVIPVFLFAFGFYYIRKTIRLNSLLGGISHVGNFGSKKLMKKYHSTIYRNGKVIRKY